MRHVSLSALALATSVPCAEAATVTVSDLIELLDRSTAIAHHGTFTFDQFDPSMGNLISSTLKFSYTFKSLMNVHTSLPQGGMAKAESDIRVDFVGGDGMPLHESVYEQTSKVSTLNLLPSNPTTVLSHSAEYHSSAFELVNYGELSGSGTFDIDYDIAAWSEFTNADGTFDLDVTLSATIEYLYAEAPVAPALPLLASSLLFMLPWRRSRR